MNTSEIISFALSVAKYTTAAADDLAELIKLTGKLHNINERLAIEENVEYLIRKQECIVARINELASKIGASAICGSDPRYATVKLYFGEMSVFADGIGVPY